MTDFINFLFLNPPTLNERKITRNCDCASESKGRYLLQPFDLLYLTARIPKEIPITLIDAVANDLSWPDIQNQIKEVRFTHIIQTMADISWDSDLQTLQNLRKNLPQAQIYVLGDALIEPENINEVLRHADGVISSPFLVSFNKEEKRLDGVKTIGAPPLVDKKAQAIQLGLPRHELFLNKSYRWPFSTHKSYMSISSNWGCPYACSYCIDSKFPNIYRPYEEVLEEMRYIKKLGIQELNFTDKSFGIPRENTIKMLKKMIEENFKFSWSTYLHPNQGDQELLQLMKKAGCHTIIIGIENYELDKLKNYNRKMNSAILDKALLNAKEIGLNVCGDFLFGLSFQNKTDIVKNIDWAVSLPIDYASFNIAAPLPGSLIKEEAIADGRMKPDDHHFDSVGRGHALDARNVTSDELIQLRNMALKKFYLRPQYLFSRLKKLRSFQHFLIQAEEMAGLVYKNLIKPRA